MKNASSLSIFMLSKNSQWYKDFFDLDKFYPYTLAMKSQNTLGFSIPKMRVHYGSFKSAYF
jgi:hypothetical protein